MVMIPRSRLNKSASAHLGFVQAPELSDDGKKFIQQETENIRRASEYANNS